MDVRHSQTRIIVVKGILYVRCCLPYLPTLWQPSFGTNQPNSQFLKYINLKNFVKAPEKLKRTKRQLWAENYSEELKIIQTIGNIYMVRVK